MTFGFTSGAWGFSNSSLGISLAINYVEGLWRASASGRLQPMSQRKVVSGTDGPKLIHRPLAFSFQPARKRIALTS